MSNNLKPGDKCIVVNGRTAVNIGKIVEITGYFDPEKDCWNGKKFVKGCTVIVKSLGSPIKTRCGTIMQECPYNPAKLRKLPNITIDIEEFLSITSKC